MKKKNDPTKYVAKVCEPMSHKIVMGVLEFNTVQLVSCMVTVKVEKIWIDVGSLEAIFVVCSNDIFSLIRETSIGNALEKSMLVF